MLIDLPAALSRLHGTHYAPVLDQTGATLTVRAADPIRPRNERPVRLLEIGGPAAAHGEWIGLLRATAAGSALIRQELEAMQADGSLAQADMPALIARIAADHPVGVHYVPGHWLDVDTMLDLAEARNFP